MFEMYYFVTDPQLVYLAFMNFISILGFFQDPLWFSIHMIDVCANVNILAKVLQAMQNTAAQVTESAHAHSYYSSKGVQKSW